MITHSPNNKPIPKYIRAEVLDEIRTDISRCKTKHECQISERDEKGKLMIGDIFCDVIGIIDKYRSES